MITLSSTQLETWLALFLFPFLRILAVFIADPLFGSRGMPIRIRVGIAVLLTFMVAPLLETPPNISLTSPQGLVVAAQQLIIGFIIGFSMRLVLVSIEMAGHIAGMTMGLGFATFFDPQNGAQSPVLAQFFGIFALLVFLAMNGHYIVISALVESFRIAPISTEPFNAIGFRSMAEAGGQIFLVGLILSLPLLAAILITNVALGVLTRAAPQLNLFAIGFPLTIMAGLVVLMLALPYLLPPIMRAFQEGVLQALKIIGQLSS